MQFWLLWIIYSYASCYLMSDNRFYSGTTSCLHLKTKSDYIVFVLTILLNFVTQNFDYFSE